VAVSGEPKPEPEPDGGLAAQTFTLRKGAARHACFVCPSQTDGAAQWVLPLGSSSCQPSPPHPTLPCLRVKIVDSPLVIIV
jgi:hypothetical protein